LKTHFFGKRTDDLYGSEDWLSTGWKNMKEAWSTNEAGLHTRIKAFDNLRMPDALADAAPFIAINMRHIQTLESLANSKQNLMAGKGRLPEFAITSRT
jgi:hypothetical protein